MAKIGRPGLSREKRADLWARWKSGQCASDIARALERVKSCGCWKFESGIRG
jgi:hypothetical protein